MLVVDADERYGSKLEPLFCGLPTAFCLFGFGIAVASVFGAAFLFILCLVSIDQGNYFILVFFPVMRSWNVCRLSLICVCCCWIVFHVFSTRSVLSSTFCSWSWNTSRWLDICSSKTVRVWEGQYTDMYRHAIWWSTCLLTYWGLEATPRVVTVSLPYLCMCVTVVCNLHSYIAIAWRIFRWSVGMIRNFER